MQQFVVGGIVGGAGRLAVALFEDEARGLVGFDASGAAVAGEAGRLDDRRRVLRAAPCSGRFRVISTSPSEYRRFSFVLNVAAALFTRS